MLKAISFFAAATARLVFFLVFLSMKSPALCGELLDVLYVIEHDFGGVEFFLAS